jgi:hypothetical protein
MAFVTTAATVRFRRNPLPFRCHSGVIRVDFAES